MKAKRKYHLTHLQWLVDLIKTERGKTTKTVVFCTTMHDVARVSGHLLGIIGEDAYIPGNPCVPSNRLLGTYHSMTWPKYKAWV